ncbi:MAG: hypothetical protein HY646_01660 [Acidobacteria bacterium]|nr:hypothetical protein [Acidobacteriota bacterium]
MKSLLLLIALMVQEPEVAPVRPSIRSGNWLEVNLRSKIQFDFSRFAPEVDRDRKALQNRALRFGANGTLFRYVDYSVEVETRKADPEFRDLFLKYRPHPSIQIQAGRFKIPFGLDQLTDSGRLDFVQRSRIGTLLSPGRDAGVMVLGEVLEGKLQYFAGIFRRDGKTSRIQNLAAIDEYRPGGTGMLAARITVTPARNLKIGGAFTRGRLTTGLSSLPGVTASEQIFFPRMYASGSRVRRGAEVSWRLHSLSIQSEFIDVREQRIGQGLRGEDLPPLRVQGWYASVAHPLMGRIENRRGRSLLGSLLPGTQLGLFEATTRYEIVRFGSESAADSRPSRNPRAAAAAGNDDRAWTFGINWHANSYVRFQFNVIRETLRDPARNPIDGQSHYWTQIGRLQLFF